MAVIDKLPSGKFRARIRRRGFKTQTKSFLRKVDAIGWARKVESEQERGVWRDIGEADRLTLGQALKRYEEEETPRHAGAGIESAHLKVIGDEPIAKRMLSDVRRAHVRELIDSWKSRDYAIATINRRLTILLAVYSVAASHWGMSGLENPFSGSKLDGATERSRRVSDAEIDAICAATSSPVLATFIRIAVETAMRRGELAQLEWSMIDLRTSVAHLPAAITKSKKARDVPLSPPTIEVLKGLQQIKEAGAHRTATARKNKKTRDVALSSSVDEVPKSFSRKKEGLVCGVQPHSVSQSFRRAVTRARALHVRNCKESGKHADVAFLVDLNYHDLRHEATSRLAKIFNLQELMKITGHTTPQMLMRYYHPDAADFAKRMRAPEAK